MYPRYKSSHLSLALNLNNYNPNLYNHPCQVLSFKIHTLFPLLISGSQISSHFLNSLVMTSTIPNTYFIHTHRYTYYFYFIKENWSESSNTPSLQSSSQSQNTTDNQSASPSWCQAPIWDPRPIFLSEVEVNLRPTVSRSVCLGVRHPSGACDQFFFLLEISFRQLRVCYRSRRHITTDNRSASPSWCQAPIWDPRPIFLSPWVFLLDSCGLVFCSVLSDDRTGL
jgi:hypothetical protein